MAHAGGRPLKFQSLNQLKDIGDRYFAETPETEWTVSGLSLALDSDRETVRNYKDNREEFSGTIKRYWGMIERAYEKDLRRKGRSGDIFALKNFGWSDRQEVEQTITADVTSNGETLSNPELAKQFADYLRTKE